MTRVVCCVAVLLLPLAAGAAQQAADRMMQAPSGIVYISGGVGKESREYLAQRSAEFNVKLVFALKSGGYLANIAVTLRDEAGKSLASITAEGPWLLLNVPAGQYTVAATFAGRILVEPVAAPKSGQRTLYFRWDEKP